MMSNRLRVQAESFVKAQLLRLLNLPVLGYAVPFLPLQPHKNAYVLSAAAFGTPQRDLSGYPIPPASYWIGYGSTAEQYLETGKRHVDAMLNLLEAAGSPITSAARILDFGCAAGRMTRWLLDYAPTREIWGTDINAAHIVWCQQHLSPPLHFSVTTTVPHLPFEDRYFDIIYAGSVFTHIDDLAKTWLLELRRVLQPGGKLLITIHDKHTIHVLKTKMAGMWLAHYLNAHPEYARFADTNFFMFTIERALRAQVFYDINWLSTMLRSMYKVVSVTQEAYAFQTAIVLEKI